jgi:hypothetical protein
MTPSHFAKLATIFLLARTSCSATPAGVSGYNNFLYASKAVAA